MLPVGRAHESAILTEHRLCGFEAGDAKSSRCQEEEDVMELRDMEVQSVSVVPWESLVSLD